MGELTTADKFNWLTREIASHIRAYPDLIAKGICTQKYADKHIAMLHAIAKDYEPKVERTTILSGG